MVAIYFYSELSTFKAALARAGGTMRLPLPQNGLAG